MMFLNDSSRPDVFRRRLGCYILVSEHLTVLNNKGINWGLVTTVRDCDRLVELLPLGSPWRKFFDILEPSYDELVYEFWSTFEYSRYIKRVAPSVSFRLGGRDHRMSLAQFAVYLGIYTREEVESVSFADTVTVHHPNMNDYWSRISDGAGGKDRNVGTIHDPLKRFMHSVISETIRGKGGYSPKVSNNDLLYLYSIFESYNFNVAHGLADYFGYYSKYLPKCLMGGSYITRLAKALGVLTLDVLRELSPPRPFGFVDHTLYLKPQSDNPLQSQLPPSEGAQVIPEVQQLQQQMLEFPQSSFYQYALQVQQPSILSSPEQVQQLPLFPEQFQPDTFFLQQSQYSPTILESYIPSFNVEQDQQQWQQSASEDTLLLQDMIDQQPTLQQPLQQSPQQIVQDIMGRQEQQQQAFTGASTSTIPPVLLPQASMETVKAMVESCVQQMQDHRQWMVQENQRIDQSIQNLTNVLTILFASSSNPPHQP